MRSRDLAWRMLPFSPVAGGAVLLGLFLADPARVEAQYFGKNKVQYDQFDTRILTTPHFDIHFYTGMESTVEDVSRMSERWYERLARLFQHEFAERKPIIFYADSPDFQQTNTVSGQIGEGTGGVTEALKNRVILPFAGSYASTDHVLGHELVHAFQYNVAESRRGGGLPALMTIPLWMIEGMAEYLSVGNVDPLTAMWLRDALLHDDFPTLLEMTNETRFFPYRFGQAFWTYVGGKYGDERVVDLFWTALRTGWEPAITQVLGMPSDSLSAQWKAAVEADYRPRMEGKTSPGEVGALLLAPSTGAGEQNVAPSVSPDGRYMVFMSERDLFSFDLYLADAQTGDILRTLANAAADPHSDALRFIDSSGGWSPNGEQIAIVTFAQGRNEIEILDAGDGDLIRRLALPERIGEITSPSFSPDGGSIVFSGQVGGTTDLYRFDLENDVLTQLTKDRYGDFQPVFSPDGGVIAFVTDRGPETDFDDMTYSEMRLALLHLDDGRIEILDLFGNVRHMNPQFSPDGQSLYFISDPDGFSDIYRFELASGTLFRVTNVATGVSGITLMSPAMSVARETGTVVFSVFDGFQYHVYSMDSRDAPAAPVTVASMDSTGRRVPSSQGPVSSRVSSYLADPRTGLVPVGSYLAADASDYKPSLSLDYVGQPTVGVGASQFGNFASGSASAFFSDMLGNRTLGVAIQAQGTTKDIGGQFSYQNAEHRWSWGVAVGRIPNLYAYVEKAAPGQGGSYEISQSVEREYWTEAMGLVSYPFSTTRRVEFSGGVTRYSFDREREVYTYDVFWRLQNYTREDANGPTSDPINFLHSSVALVWDNSFFGLTSPVRGSRYRLELGTVSGNLDYRSVLVDYRRYFNPLMNLTLAFRAFHYGRYGGQVEGSVLRPLFLGTETLMRGYEYYSFDPLECTNSIEFGTCPERDRLYGHRIGVANAEVRVPLFGGDRLGLIDLSFVPTELVLFTDAGLAWDADNDPVFDFTRSPLARIPVMSTGASARMNLFGFLIVEVYYAVPWQRPNKGGHWGLQLAPGW
ncbi:MAG: peptidase S9 [Gemmatimonadetes bacterium]|nr:peptidase S9 [Gemmatimonadota bacterium]